MSKQPAGGKWVSNRAQAARAGEPPQAPAAPQPNRAAGSQGFEDQSIQVRAHANAPAEEQAQGQNFDRQIATDALSNLYLFRHSEDEAWPTLELADNVVYPTSNVDFHSQLMAVLKSKY